jgi:hypothetical protein
MNKLFRLALCSALVLAGQSATAKCMHYELPTIELVGRVTRVAWPANRPVGEQNYSWYFEPEEPLCIAAGPDALGNVPVQRARRFEILPPPSGQSLTPFLGRSVLLKGTFVPTQIPHFHHLTFSVESARLRHAP